MLRMITQILLVLSRLTFAGWVGGAVLFVMAGIAEVFHPGFDSMIKDQLVTVRFPVYYAFGAVLAGTGTLSVTGYWFLTGHRHAGWQIRSPRWPLLLAWLGLALMLWDYLTVYLPLADLVTPPGKPRTQEFDHLHHWSMYINTAGLLLFAMAAVLLNLPTSTSSTAAAHPPA